MTGKEGRAGRGSEQLGLLHEASDDIGLNPDRNPDIYPLLERDDRMTADLLATLRAAIPDLRGELEADAPLAPISWFRAGGRAQLLLTPADLADLQYVLARFAQLPAARELTILTIGLGSNLLVRDGGVAGLVIRLGRGFTQVTSEAGERVRAGAAAPDVKVALGAAKFGLAGLSFYRGIPGTVGGALRMNAGAYGGETKDVLVEAKAVDREGRIVTLSNAEMGFVYRRSAAPDDLIFVEALFQGRAGDTETIRAEMQEITGKRSTTQPVNTHTGGSTFKNPPGRKSWQLIDAAGCRGLRIGDAQVSELHCNFLINHGAATATEIEELGEEVRRKVREHSGVELEWEIKRIGVPLGPRASRPHL
ncbi:UDP-N-acetylmuramate dehydrogenase [Rhizobiales bacterium GAS191]|nr:UDP-N-acetylmuramate dehydrogenase [Rhizobiales bacterium GAS188]SEE94126.1 UDP-N-acetylmuramate dehydrogenase [Rhizobiales bacterium GAS191]